ncbi:hypothetical protein HDU98_009635 [Podochytrium sp. JEL0797]|nr:hypothetical protein HDU98_009635 [Podochytrium sp. JEL0797]
MSQQSTALLTVRRFTDALSSKNFDVARSLCDESVFVGAARPASLNIPNTNLTEYLAYFAMFESMELTTDEDEVFEYKKDDRTLVMRHTTSKSVVAGMKFTNEFISTLEINQAGLIVRVVEFVDSRVILAGSRSEILPTALATVRCFEAALASKNLELARSLCEESTFVAVARPASFNTPNKSLSAYMAFFAMFESMERTIDENEIFEFKGDARTVVIFHAKSTGMVAGKKF